MISLDKTSSSLQQLETKIDQTYTKKGKLNSNIVKLKTAINKFKHTITHLFQKKQIPLSDQIYMGLQQNAQDLTQKMREAEAHLHANHSYETLEADLRVREEISNQAHTLLALFHKMAGLSKRAPKQAAKAKLERHLNDIMTHNKDAIAYDRTMLMGKIAKPQVGKLSRERYQDLHQVFFPSDQIYRGLQQNAQDLMQKMREAEAHLHANHSYETLEADLRVREEISNQVHTLLALFHKMAGLSKRAPKQAAKAELERHLNDIMTHNKEAIAYDRTMLMGKIAKPQVGKLNRERYQNLHQVFFPKVAKPQVGKLSRERYQNLHQVFFPKVAKPKVGKLNKLVFEKALNLPSPKRREEIRESQTPAFRRVQMAHAKAALEFDSKFKDLAALQPKPKMEKIPVHVPRETLIQKLPVVVKNLVEAQSDLIEHLAPIRGKPLPKAIAQMEWHKKSNEALVEIAYQILETIAEAHLKSEKKMAISLRKEMRELGKLLEQLRTPESTKVANEILLDHINELKSKKTERLIFFEKVKEIKTQGQESLTHAIKVAREKGGEAFTQKLNGKMHWLSIASRENHALSQMEIQASQKFSSARGIEAIRLIKVGYEGAFIPDAVQDAIKGLEARIEIMKGIEG